MLYQPTESEITEILSRARCAWPHLASRIDQAETILKLFDIRHDPEPLGWQVASQSTDAWYVVDTGGCGCMDYLSTRVRAGGRAMCKHYIAYLSYQRILIDHLEALVDPAPANGAAIRRVLKLRQPELIQLDGHLVGADFVTPGQEFRIKIGYNYSQSRRAFKNDGDMAAYAHWLHAAQPAIRQREADRATYASAYKVPIEDQNPAAIAPECQPQRPRRTHGWLVPIWEQQPVPAWEHGPT